MSTNYNDTKVHVGDTSLPDASVAPALITQILKTLGNTVHVAAVDSASLTLTGDELHGRDVVFVDQNALTDGVLNLAETKAADISGVDAFIFTGSNGVNFTLDGTLKADQQTHNTVAFKGVVNTLGGDDTIFIHSSQGVTVSAGEGANTIVTGAADATTGSGNDKIIVGDGKNDITTGAGNDTVIAGNGSDTISTGAGNDSVVTGSGNDSISTGIGNDTVIAGAGNDSILTGAGNDSISTGLGNDTVDAGAGNDTIYVGAAVSPGTEGEIKTIYGGAGNDIIKLAAGYIGNATIDGDGGDIGTLANGTNDQLNLSKVVIDNVQLYNSNGDIVDPTFDAKHKLSTDADYKNDLHLKITLQNSDGSTSVLDVQHFEKFVYDTSTADTDGAIKITGVDQFYAQFHHPLS